MEHPLAYPLKGQTRRGSYGLHLPTVEAADLLNDVPADAPTVLVEHVNSDEPQGDLEVVENDFASFPNEPGRVNIRRKREAGEHEPVATVTYVCPSPLPHRHVVHPFLAIAAATISRWLGRQAFHAGSIEIDGQAWAIIGPKEAGKSSLAMVLASRGHGLVSDDLTVVSHGRVFPGPRCVDLRTDVAELVGGADDMGVVGFRRRARVTFGPVAELLPFGGWIAPEWGSATVVAPVAPSQRLPLIMRELSLRLVPSDPTDLLDCAARPMVRFVRKREWSATESAVTALVDHIHHISS